MILQTQEEKNYWQKHLKTLENSFLRVNISKKILNYNLTVLIKLTNQTLLTNIKTSTKNKGRLY